MDTTHLYLGVFALVDGIILGLANTWIGDFFTLLFDTALLVCQTIIEKPEIHSRTI